MFRDQPCELYESIEYMYAFAAKTPNPYFTIVLRAYKEIKNLSHWNKIPEQSCYRTRFLKELLPYLPT